MYVISHLSLYPSIGIFILLCLAVILIGRKLSYYADYLGEITGIGKGFIGLFLLATLTSVPELITSFSAVAFLKEPQLAGGNVFGSNCFNLVIIIVIAIWLKTLPRTKSYQHLYNAIIINLITVFIIFKYVCNEVFSHFFSLIVAIIIVFLYFSSLKITHSTERFEKEGEKKTDTNVKKINFFYFKFFTAGVGIVIVSYLLTAVVDRISILTGWGSSFGGFLLLAIATSLPELSTTISSMKYDIDMAFGNILGSNIFNPSILALIKLFFPKVNIFSLLSESNILAALLSLLLLNGLIFYFYYPRRIKFFKKGWDIIPLLLIIIYFIGSYFVFKYSKL